MPRAKPIRRRRPRAEERKNLQVDSVAYLTTAGTWPSFLNKAAYCRKTRRAFYLWVGNLDRELLDARPGGSLPRAAR